VTRHKSASERRVRAALRDAIVTGTMELRSAIESILPHNPDDDQVVQWWAGHIATWRLALGDSMKAIAADYELLVLEERDNREVPF
jgi:hypothetical protein